MTKSPTKHKRKPPGKVTDESKPIIDRKAAFVRAYMGEAKFNASKAAVMAGYGEGYAASAGSKLLDDPDVIAQIDAIRRERARRTEVTAAEISAGLVDIFHGRTLATVGLHDGTPVLGEPKHGDRIRAAELLAKLNGWTVDRTETTVTMQPPTAESARRLAETLEIKERLEREKESREK